MKKINTSVYCTPYQLKLPLEIEKIIEISDPVYTFSEVLSHIDLNKYLVVKGHRRGRKRYDSETMLKVVLFAFMENGYASTRDIEKFCKTDIRYMWLLNGLKAPCHMKFDNFMNDELAVSIKDILREINAYIFEQEEVDTEHVYIDGTKIVANVNKYSWVWKKSSIKNRDKTFVKVTALIEEMNQTLLNHGVKIELRKECAIEYLEDVLEQYAKLTELSPEKIVRGRGHHKSTEQRYYDTLFAYINK